MPTTPRATLSAERAADCVTRPDLYRPVVAVLVDFTVGQPSG